MSTELLEQDEVLAMLRVSQSTLYRLRKGHGFPLPSER